MAKQKVCWEADDGTLFETEELAVEHDNVMEFFDWCQDNICCGGEWSASMVAQEILKHWEVKKKL